MKTLLPVLILSVFLAYLAEKDASSELVYGKTRSFPRSIWMTLLLVTLILPVGLRTEYNDTLAYIHNFESAPTIGSLLTSGRLQLLANPAYAILVSLFKTILPDYHAFFMVVAAFTQIAFVKTMWRYSKSFPLSIFIYICLGTYVFSMAATKQVIAMAILSLAFPSLMNKKYGKFIGLTVLAALFHTYAIAYLLLLAFYERPWRFRTVALLLATIVIMQNFDVAIGSFLEYSAESGKTIAEYEVFDNAQVNIYRVAVYAVVPLLSLVFWNHLFLDHSTTREMLVNMSILSFSFMLMGTVNGANMFGRMSMYFEIGTVCSLPGIIHESFEKRSSRVISICTAICFFAYFSYAYYFGKNFDSEYRAITLWEYILSLLEMI